MLWRAELLARHDLEDVAGEDVLAGPLDDVAVGRAAVKFESPLAIVRMSIVER